MKSQIYFEDYLGFRPNEHREAFVMNQVQTKSQVIRRYRFFVRICLVHVSSARKLQRQLRNVRQRANGIQNCKRQIFAFDEAEDIYIGHVLHRISLRHSTGINPNTLLSATFPREVLDALKDVCLDIPPAYDLYEATS